MSLAFIIGAGDEIRTHGHLPWQGNAHYEPVPKCVEQRPEMCRTTSQNV